MPHRRPVESTRPQVADLRAQGLSVRAISERTGIPRSTVADHVAALRGEGPEWITGRDGRLYPAVWAPAGPPPPARERARGGTIDRELARMLLLDHLRLARLLVRDAVPLSDDDRRRLARDLHAVARTVG